MSRVMSVYKVMSRVMSVYKNLYGQASVMQILMVL